MSGISIDPPGTADAPAQDVGHQRTPPAADPASSIGAIRAVLRVRAFRRLWYATALSSLGDWLGILATTALATQLVHGYQAKNYALGGVLVVKLLPAIVLGPLAGAFADRFDRRRTMVISDALRFGLFITIPIVHGYAWLLVASFLIECISLFWLPAKDASVPNLVRRDQIEAANQLGLITTYGLTSVGGAGLFAIMSKLNPINLALYFNAGTFLVGALVVFFIREISGNRGDKRPEDQPSLVFLIREGASFIRSSRLLRGLIVGLVGAFFGGGAVIGAGKAFVVSLGGGNSAYGVLFGTVFVGLGSGMAFGPRIARELSRKRLFGLSIVFGGICLVLTAVMPQVALAMIFVLGVGFGAGVAYLSGTTLLGTEIGDEMRGRVFALLQSLIRIVLILGLALVPFVVGSVGRNTFRLPWGAHVTVDGTRFVLVAGGAIAIALGLFAFRVMDESEHVAVWADFRSSLLRDTSTRRRMSGGGMFIAFEGGEGSGKSTQVALLAEALTAAGATVLVTHEPGATAAGQGIRELVLHAPEPLTARAEALLFAADRAHHVATVVRPALDAGQVVLSDRYIDSSLAYQGVGRDLTMDEVRKLSRWATGDLRPDLTIVLDLPAGDGLARVHGRGTADKVESESVEFHERVRLAFRGLAEANPRRYLVLDARRPIEELSGQALAGVEHLLITDRKWKRSQAAARRV